MAAVYEELDDKLTALVEQQRVFFVATAPTDPSGHLNVSPKGYDTFRVLGPRTVAYLDLTGSGVETIAHVRDNGRVTLMFCTFEGPPKIVRLYGRGEVVLPGDADFAGLRERFGDHAGVRAVIRIGLTRVQTSCGYAVPLMRFEGERDVLRDAYERKGAAGMETLRAKNLVSIDGLPGVALGGDGG